MTITLNWSKGIPANAMQQIGEITAQLNTKATELHNRRMEIADTYRDYGHDAFEMWEADGVTLAEVEDALGEDAYAEYAAWCYLNLK